MKTARRGRGAPQKTAPSRKRPVRSAGGKPPRRRGKTTPAGLQSALWQAVLDTARDAIISIDPSGTITLFNRSAEETFGYTAAEVVGKTVEVLMPSPYAEEHAHYLERYERTGEARAIGQVREVQGRRKNGEVFPIEISVSEARSGRTRAYTAIVRDVTRRRQAAEALRRERDFAECVIETAPALVLVLDVEGRVARFNRSMEQVCGHASAEVRGRDWYEMFVPWSERPGFRAMVEQALRGGPTRVETYAIVTGDGRERQVEWHLSALRDPGDSVVGVLAIGHDVTEHRRAEAALRSSEERFASFMAHLPGVAFIKDAQGKYVFVNRRFEELFSRSLREIRGLADDDVWPAHTAAQLKANDLQVMETGSVLHGIELIPHPDGTVHRWWASKFRIDHGADRAPLLAGVAVDMTEQLRAEEALRDLQKAAQQRERLADIGAITAQIVHDLGNPLAAVSMQAQLILRRIQRDASQPIHTAAKPAEQILAEVRRLMELVGNFMDFSREQRVRIETIDAKAFLQGIVDTWQPLAEERHVKLRLETPVAVPPLRVDPDKLRRVFDNLVKNAIEAIVPPDSGDVVLRVALPTRETVRISVCDNGSGIPESVHPFRLFETTKTHGSGIGLAIAKQIVQAHGGQIDYANAEPQGTVFHVELPCAGPLV